MNDEIVCVGARGDGMTADGRYAPLAAPGDRLTAEGTIIAGPHHRPPACRHYPRCGGCQLQHLDDASYADFVHDRVASALAAQRLSAPIRAPHLSPPDSRRRATLHAERRGKAVLLGFSAAGSHQLVDIVDCAILHPALFAVLQSLRAMLVDVMPSRGRVDMQMTLVDQGIDLLLKGVEADGLKAAEALADFAAAQGLARLSIDQGLGPETRWAPVEPTVTLGGVPVGFPDGAFLQATVDGEAALVAAVREAVGEAAIIADLFAGLGTFALSLATGRRILAAEAAREAIMTLGVAGATRGIATAHRDLYRRPLMADELARFDAVVLDPPRAGAREQAEQLAASAVPVIAYVSCNPSTFARDVKIMCEKGYVLDWVQPVGQFRWSTHVELAARLSRQG